MPQEKVTLSIDPFQRLRHDLRGRLNGILGFGQLLADSTLDDEQRHFLGKILSSGDSLLSLIDQITPGLTSQSLASCEPFLEVLPSDDSPMEESVTFDNKRGHIILMIDDEVSNLDVLEKALSKSGHHILTASSAAMARDHIRSILPDIILMDLLMPGVSGYDLCRELKDNPLTQAIPVVFLSSVTDIKGRLKAYEAGGVDFILKPFYAREVVVRIHTHLQLLDARKKLERYTKSLESLVKERTEQLIHQDRMASVGLMSAGVVHEINNPVTFIQGNLSILKRFEQDLSSALSALSVEQRKSTKTDFILKEMPSLLKEMQSGVDRIISIVSGLKSFSRKDPSSKTTLDVREPIEEAFKLTVSEMKRFKVEKKWPSTLPPILGNAQQLSQAFVNLFVNAGHAMQGKSDGCLTVEIEWVGKKQIVIRVRDNGCGMSAETLSKIWLPFFTTKPKNIGTGLGMPIVHGIIEDHAGTVRAFIEPGQGTIFEIHFPALEKEA